MDAIRCTGLHSIARGGIITINAVDARTLLEAGMLTEEAAEAVDRMRRPLATRVDAMMTLAILVHLSRLAQTVERDLLRPDRQSGESLRVCQ